MSSSAEALRLTRTFEAELRAVEEGHHAIALDGPGRFRVVSDVRPTEWRYTVRAEAGIVTGPDPVVWGPRFTCDHLLVMGTMHRYTTTLAGLTACKHAALVARRLAREGLLEFDPELGWAAPDDAALRAHLEAPPVGRTVDDDDLFANL